MAARSQRRSLSTTRRFIRCVELESLNLNSNARLRTFVIGRFLMDASIVEQLFDGKFVSSSQSDCGNDFALCVIRQPTSLDCSLYHFVRKLLRRRFHQIMRLQPALLHDVADGLWAEVSFDRHTVIRLSVEQDQRNLKTAVDSLCCEADGVPDSNRASTRPADLRLCRSNQPLRKTICWHDSK